MRLALQHAGCSAELSEARSLDQSWQLLGQFRACLLLLEFTAENLPALAARLRMLSSHGPHVCPVAAGQRRLRPCRWMLREAGAVHVVFSPRQLSDVVGLARRHWARAPSADEVPLEEQIWSRLPWQRQNAT
jgi:hypothetical protein